jgi:DNA primase
MVGFVLGNVALDEFTEGPPRDLARTLADMYKRGTVRSQEVLSGEYGSVLQRLGTAVLMDKHEVSENWVRKQDVSVPSLNDRPYEAAESAMKFLKLDRVNEAIEEVREQMYSATQDGDEDQVERLQQKMMSLQELRKQVRQGAFIERPSKT